MGVDPTQLPQLTHTTAIRNIPHHLAHRGSCACILTRSVSSNHPAMASAAAVTSTDAAAAGTPAKTYAAPRITPGMLLNLIAIADEDRHGFLVPDAYPFNIRYAGVYSMPQSA